MTDNSYSMKNLQPTPPLQSPGIFLVITSEEISDNTTTTKPKIVRGSPWLPKKSAKGFSLVSLRVSLMICNIVLFGLEVVRPHPRRLENLLSEPSSSSLERPQARCTFYDPVEILGYRDWRGGFFASSFATMGFIIAIKEGGTETRAAG